MKSNYKNIKVIIKTKLNKTENPSKVKTCLTNITTKNSTIKEQNENYLYIEGNLELLNTIKKKIKQEELEDITKQILYKNKKENSLTFYINKQSALNNKFHIIDENMSVLEDIEVNIKTDNPKEIINWIIT